MSLKRRKRTENRPATGPPCPVCGNRGCLIGEAFYRQGERDKAVLQKMFAHLGGPDNGRSTFVPNATGRDTHGEAKPFVQGKETV